MGLLLPLAPPRPLGISTSAHLWLPILLLLILVTVIILLLITKMIITNGNSNNNGNNDDDNEAAGIPNPRTFVARPLREDSSVRGRPPARDRGAQCKIARLVSLCAASSATTLRSTQAPLGGTRKLPGRFLYILFGGNCENHRKSVDNGRTQSQRKL